MELQGTQRYARPFMSLVIAGGLAACLWSALHLPWRTLDLRYLMLVGVTVLLGTRIVVNIPRLSSQITLSDTFVLLTLLLFGREAAVLLAAVDGGCASLRFNKKRFNVLFNVGVVAGSAYFTGTLLRVLYGPLPTLATAGLSGRYLVALALMAFVQYVTNSGVVAIAVALRAGQPLWLTWRQNFLWTSLTYFTGASAAGLINHLAGLFGFYALLVSAPIIAIIYFTYATYMKTVEVSAQQAEQAQRHAAEAQRHVAALQASEARFRSAFDHATIGMALVAPDGRFIQVNPSLSASVGYTEEELLALNFQTLTHKSDLPALLSSVTRLLEGQLPAYQAEHRFMHRHGHEVWMHLGSSLVLDGQGQPLHLLFQLQDVTDRKRAEERLLHDALHDVLTGLPNRALFMDHLKLAIQRAKRTPGRLFAALFLDLDRFKIVNDSLGHMVGDQLLVGIARRLETCLRPGDTVARLGGDEFTVLLEELTDMSDAIQITQRIQQELSMPFNLGGHEVFTTVSIGIAPSLTGYDRAEDLLRDADTAMYRAKMSGKNRHVVFDKAMHDRAVNLLQMETDLRRAIEREEFCLHYQPIVALTDGHVTGFEALVRWQHPQRGFISPMDFIPVAEETGLIVPLGRWVMREACRQARRWHELLPAAARFAVSINLSSKQLAQNGFVEQVAAVLEETGVPAHRLKLEITESMVIENTDTTVELLTQLRALGVALAIDDFGTGYSSLSYLHRFPIDTLKIDRSFVSQMHKPENAEIVRTIITLARSLEMDVVAEGVETAAQLAQLRALGCDYAQGFLFARPLAVPAADELVSGEHHFHSNLAELPAARAAKPEPPLIA
ncbi:MAG TPA: EAL domain-containing protein [Pyrinomonadaceae bacterium]|jgi:diguanylate cyclase (GGDEF)-like protein/PAS domain S-box-containing protein